MFNILSKLKKVVNNISSNVVEFVTETLPVFLGIKAPPKPKPKPPKPKTSTFSEPKRYNPINIDRAIQILQRYNILTARGRVYFVSLVVQGREELLRLDNEYPIKAVARLRAMMKNSPGIEKQSDSTDYNLIHVDMTVSRAESKSLSSAANTTEAVRIANQYLQTGTIFVPDSEDIENLDHLLHHLRSSSYSTCRKLRAPAGYTVDEWCAFDIETASDGTLLDIGFLSFDETYFVSDSVASFMRLIEELSSDRMLHIAGYNLTYDIRIFWQFLNHTRPTSSAGNVLKKSDAKRLEINLRRSAMVPIDYKNWQLGLQIVGGNVIAATIYDKVNPKKRKKLAHFFDLSRHISTGLDSAAKTFAGLQKIDVSPEFKSCMEQFKQLYTIEYYNYLERDVVATREATIGYWREVRRLFNIDKVFATVPSLAAKILTPEKCYSSHDNYVTMCEKMSYKGGLVISNLLYEPKHAYAFDVNKMYGSVMRDFSFPTGQPYLLEIKNLDDLNQIDGLKLIAFEYRHELRDIDKRQWMKLRFKKFPTLRDLDGRMSLAGESIEWLETIPIYQKLGYTITPKFALIYNNHEPIFNESMSKILGLGVEAKKSGDKTTETLLKLVGNSGYGKFGQSSIMSQWHTNEDEFRNKLEYHNIGYVDRGGFLEIEVESTPGTQSYAIASRITSLARMKLLEAIYDIVSRDGEFYQCDTDSIIASIPLSEKFLDKYEPGKFGFEREGPFMNAGPKIYVHGTKTACKGGKINNGLDDLQKIHRGEFVAEIRTPISLIQSLIEWRNPWRWYILRREIKPILAKYLR